MGEGKLVFARKASGLVKELSAIDVIMWAIGTPAISGILYFAAREMFKYSASSIMTAYALGGLMLLPIILALSFMTSSMPRAGGMYMGVSRVLSPSIGFLLSWIQLFGFGIVTGVLACVSALMLGAGLALAGVITGNAFLSDASAFIFTTTGTVVSAVILIVILWIVGLTAMKVIKWLERILFIVPMLTLVLMAAFILINGPSGYPAAFDAIWGDGAYNAIIASAQNLGYTLPTFTWDYVSSALLITLWSYAGFEVVTYASGEIKTPRRSLLIGVIGGFIGLVLLYIAVTALTGYIGEFVCSYSFLYYNHKSVLETIMATAVEPSLPFFAASVMPGWLGVLVLLSMVLWYAKTILPVFIAGSRIVFACAMDRMLPMGLTKINKWGAPTWSTHIVGILAFLGLGVFTMNIGPALGVLTWSTMVFFWLFGLATLLFPYIRSDIYEKSPIQWRIGGVPVISIIGLLSMATGFFIFAYTLTEFDVAAVTLVSIILVIGFILHLWQLSKNKAEGVEMREIYSSLPPE